MHPDQAPLLPDGSVRLFENLGAQPIVLEFCNYVAALGVTGLRICAVK